MGTVFDTPNRAIGVQIANRSQEHYGDAHP